ncbi:DUF6404 family protein [Dongia deserti]|uniref:DUF6404 family protein n=1 Tax=Dongia deserti TaxID=2268030 RepID=UPI000E65963D|nr:DUF6404 family protein [Dongia deserti]
MRDWESFQRRLDAAHALLAQKGLIRGKRNYFLTRVLWSVGITVRPPLFASFGANALLHGALYALSWGTGMWILSWQDDGQSVTAAVLWSGISGPLFGAALAAYYRRLARKHDLPDWDELPDLVDVFD